MLIVLALVLAACGKKSPDVVNVSPVSEEAAQLNAVSEGNTTPETESQVQIVETAHAEDGVPLVYFTADISPEGLQAVYEALAWNPGGNLAIKVSTGEPPVSNYLRAELIGPWYSPWEVQ